MIGAFVGVLNQTLMTTILPEIMKDFTVSSSTAQWLTQQFYASQWDYDSYHSFLIERFTLRSLFLMQHAF